jgi:hypothetical protein
MFTLSVDGVVPTCSLATVWFAYQPLLADFELGPGEEVSFEIDELLN